MKFNVIRNNIIRKISNLIKIILSPRMAFLPGNLAFFLMLSIFPLLTLFGAITSIFSINIDSIINIINSQLPSNIANVLIDFITGKGLDTHLGIFMIVGFILASNGTHAMILASNELYGFKNDTYIKRRIKAIILIIILLLLFIFMLGFMAFGGKIINLLYRYIENRELVDLIRNLFTILKWPFSIFVIYFNIKLIYTISPDHKILSKNTSNGAVFTTLSWIVVIEIYSYWVEHFVNYDIYYGSLSNIAILMLMIYLISFILVIGIAINVRTYEYNLENGK